MVNRLRATFVYDEKVAKSFHKMDYFMAQVKHLRNIQKIEDSKPNYRGKRDERVTEIRDHYQKLGMTEEIRIFRVLERIRNKVIKCIKNKQPLPLHRDLINIIAHPNMLLAAYRTIRPNKGAKTHAFPIPEAEFNALSLEEKRLYIMLFNLPDGLEFETLHEISALIKSGTYPWGCTRLIWIPKPGTSRRRPISVPPFADRMVQESIRMVLESIYEPVFQSQNLCFGFRASNGVHEAITKITDPRLTSGLHMALEGDIEEAYPNLDRNILIQILGNRIHDKAFLRLMKKRLHLRLYETEQKQYQQTLTGIPQGGIDSPYLWNIYLLGLDEYIQKNIQQYLDKLNDKRLEKRGHGAKPGETVKESPINPIYNSLGKKLTALSKQIKTVKTCIKAKKDIKKNTKKIFTLISEKRLVRHTRLKTRSTDPHRYKLKFCYARYADDWILVTNAPKKVVGRIKQLITDWLLTHRKAKLSQTKTLITDMRLKPAHFLGFELKNTKTRRLKKTPQGLKRTTGWQIITSADKTRLINRLFMKGYCQRNGFPKEIPWLATFDPFVIIQRFNSVITGMANFYADFIRFPSTLHRWLYIVRFACLKTLACKYKTNIAGIFKRFGEEVTVKVRGRIECEVLEKSISLLTAQQVIRQAKKLRPRYKILSKLLEIDKGSFVFSEDKKRGRTPRIMDEDFLEKINWVNFRTQASLDMPCLVCGNEITEMHHIRHVRKTSFTDIAPQDSVARAMYLRNRKQAPLCRNCHLNRLHAGRICLAQSLSELVDQTYVDKLLEVDTIMEVHFDTRARVLDRKLNDTRALDQEAKISKNPNAFSQDFPTLTAKLLSKGWKKAK